MERRTGSGPGTRPAPLPGSAPFPRCWRPGRMRRPGRPAADMVTTTRIHLDRIASSTRNAKLAPDVIVGNEIVAREGYVLAVRILEDKSTYNTVEDLSGRMVSL